MLFALAFLLVLVPGEHASSKSVSDIVKEANASASASQQEAMRLIDQMRKNAAAHDVTKVVNEARVSANGFLVDDKHAPVIASPGAKNERKPFNGFGMPFVETPSQGCSSCQVTRKDEERPSYQETQVPQAPPAVSSPQERREGPSDDYIVCVSFSLPQASLKTLLDHAAKRNIRVVVRGLIENSWVKTTKRMREIGLPLDIDPEIFEKYAVTHVPTFIKVTPEGFHKVQGNITLDYALNKLDRAL